jgi:hypothetical protein
MTMFYRFNKIACLLLVACFLRFQLQAQTQNENTKLLPKLLKKEKLFDSITKKSGAYDVQIIYTKVERKNKGIEFTDYHYNVNNGKYFYPSNTVFLPVSALTLEKINKLAEENDVNKDRYVRIDDAVDHHILVYQDTSSESNYASFSNFIRKMFTLGDKHSYNYCYDFLNQQHFNERMHSLGYNNSWFLHKFNSKNLEDSRQSNTVTFFRTDMKSYFVDIIYLKRYATTIPFYSVYVKNAEYNQNDYYSTQAKVLMGKGFVENGAVVNSPMDFTKHNKFSIKDMHNFLKSIIFPEFQKNKLNLTDEDYAFLYKHMSNNDSINYILRDKLNDPSIKIFNNSGQAMGFMIENAYVIDTKNGVEFFLTAVINCNSENIFGEEYYEYDKIGLPFMQNIGNFIHDYEIKKRDKPVNFDTFLAKIKE